LRNQGVDLRINDVITSITTLDNYYAYDDGTAENSAGINQRLGQVAVKYELNKPDALTAMRVYLPKTIRDQSTESLVLQVLGDKNGLPDQILGQQNFKIKYGSKLDEFVEFKFDIPINVTGTFYIGWRQLTDNIMPVGLDKNSIYPQKIYYSLRNEWTADTTLKGSLMMRPVMLGRTATITASEPILQDISIYPNPSTGTIRWEYSGIREIWVLDTFGKEVIRKSYQPTDDKQLSLEGLANGLYLMTLSDGERSITKKVLIQK
jgi:hypothetical protein